MKRNISHNIKVGFKITLRNDLLSQTVYGNQTFIRDMYNHGLTLTVKKIISEFNAVAVREFDEDYWFFTIDMIESYHNFKYGK
jgi:hypothetical protein